jgi:hypothetical protein
MSIEQLRLKLCASRRTTGRMRRREAAAPAPAAADGTGPSRRWDGGTSPSRRWDGGTSPSRRWDGGLRHQPYRSIAWTISSSRLPTVTARLAKLARLTPRLPRTSLKSFWSVVW